jgi:microcompartment protein CcmK/EutM
MYVARVAGTVVCTRKVPELEGFKLLVVKKENLSGETGQELAVAVDVVGAGSGEKVLVVSGSSARQTRRTDRKPVDAVIVGIVDQITLDEESAG